MARWDAVVVGGGHAGCEAARLLSLRGLCTALVTDRREAIGRMSCNPSVGGVGKGHLVRELDALGGLMGKAADRTGTHFRLLNASKGPAVQGLRCQSDRDCYSRTVRGLVEATPGLEVLEGRVAGLLLAGGRAAGVVLEGGGTIEARAVVLTAGTFLGAEMHVGEERTPGGRTGEFAAAALSNFLKNMGVAMLRLKTGTPCRLHRDSIRWETLERQEGDPSPEPFSLQSAPFPVLPQMACHLTRTTAATAALVRANLHRSPLYAGAIRGVGPRYCPSLEDKVVRFPHHETHQVFLEPDGLESEEVYPNGLSTSLPREVQEALVRTLPGLEEARLLRHGYAVEYDAVDPRQVTASLECRAFPGFYLAGQVLGTTGYEEAAALGLWAGYNAARALRGEPPFRLRRDEAYLAVLVDDLVTRGVTEPYRMFTSRAEHRLLLDRHSAYRRLSAYGEADGVVPAAEAAEVRDREAAVERILRRLRAERLPGTGERPTLAAWLARPGADPAELLPLLSEPAFERREVREYVASEVKGEGYRERERQEARRIARAGATALPADLAYGAIPGLSREVVERLTAARPETLGQAARIPGVTPAALTLLRVAAAGRGRA